MPELSTIYDYMRRHAALLGDRILQQYPALHQFDDPVSPRIEGLLRTPFPAQIIAIMGVANRWHQARTAMVVAECGTGKTLISLGAIDVHCGGSSFTALAMVPPHLVEKWAREAFLTIPRLRVFLIDDLRNGGDENKCHGVNEVRLRQGRIVREGLRTTLSELRMRKDSASARKRWLSLCGRPSLFIVGRERAKLGYFWRHAYRVPGSGPYVGCVVNSDTGKPVIVNDSRLVACDFEKTKISEIIETRGEKSCRSLHSPLWQADADKIRRMAPIEFIGRYMPEWFDYAICDEIHQLAGDTAQGNALGTLASCTDRIVGLTGTLLGGYADDLFNTLFRLEARRMKEHGYEWGTTGRSSFIQDYGVLETITKVEPTNNACSKAKSTSTVRRKPGASPLLFGEFLMQLCAFVFLEDISAELPPYEETYLSVPMDPPMREAYRELEHEIRKALKAHRGNRSALSIMLNTLLVYPDHPYGLGTLYGKEFDSELKRTVRFVIAEPRDLAEDGVYSKERKLVEEIKKELAEGRRCQVFVVYTTKHDVTARLRRILDNEGIRTVVLRASVDTSKREAWYARQVKDGTQVVICHPKLVETGLDLLDFPTILFYESGYSLHTLRQASRRSWRIGQRRPVRVKFLCYEGTMQTSCLRLMGKKLLVALTMEGKFAGEGLQSIDEDDDMLSAMARELVERNGIGETADAVWKALNLEHQKLFPTTSVRTDDASASEESIFHAQDDPAGLVEGVFETAPILVFGRRPELSSGRRRRAEFLEFEDRISNHKGENSMSETSTLIGYSGRTIGREELALVPTPPATETHRPVPHHEIVQALIETLGFRHIGVVHDEYAVSPDGMKGFGVLDLTTEMEGCRFSIGLRNSHDKSMRLALTCGYRVFVCSNMAFAGDFTPVLAKHSKSFSLIDCMAVGVDRMQRNFEPMRKQVEAWQRSELTDVTAKVVIYEAFVEGKLEAPKHLARTVHDLYFEPKYKEFRPRTIWSLSNAFTSAFKELEPIPQFKATAKLGEFLEDRFAQSF